MHTPGPSQLYLSVGLEANLALAPMCRPEHFAGQPQSSPLGPQTNPILQHTDGPLNDSATRGPTARLTFWQTIRLLALLGSSGGRPLHATTTFVLLTQHNGTAFEMTTSFSHRRVCALAKWRRPSPATEIKIGGSG